MANITNGIAVQTRPGPGKTPYPSITAKSTSVERNRSTSAASTGAIGASSRGNHTLVRSDALPTRLPDASVTELAKKSQITDPESVSSAYEPGE